MGFGFEAFAADSLVEARVKTSSPLKLTDLQCKVTCILYFIHSFQAAWQFSIIESNRKVFRVHVRYFASNFAVSADLLLN